MNTIESAKPNVLRWFTGKARDRAMTALQMLEDSEKAGEWLPGVSRSVRAALNKSNVAHKIAEEYGGQIGNLIESKEKYGLGPSWRLMHYMRFGQFDLACAADFDFASFEQVLEAQRAFFGPKFDDIKGALARAKAWVNDFKPVEQLVAQLDAARPMPVFTSIGVSPTITKTLEQLNFHYSAPGSIRLCPMRFERIETTDAKGKKSTMPIIILEWPKGTVHGASAHAETPGFEWPESKCHSCGHGIKNSSNWVPLLVDDSNGVPHALWVGADCSRSLFGIKVKGAIDIKRT